MSSSQNEDGVTEKAIQCYVHKTVEGEVNFCVKQIGLNTVFGCESSI